MTPFTQRVKEFMEAVGAKLLPYGIWQHPQLERGLTPEEAAFIYRQTVEARRDELKRKYSLHVELMSSADFKAGFSEALDQIDASDAIRFAKLDNLLQDPGTAGEGSTL